MCIGYQGTSLPHSRLRTSRSSGFLGFWVQVSGLAVFGALDVVGWASQGQAWVISIQRTVMCVHILACAPIYCLRFVSLRLAVVQRSLRVLGEPHALGPQSPNPKPESIECKDKPQPNPQSKPNQGR